MEALSVVTTSLPAGELGEPYETQLEATGGFAPYSWSRDEGLIPAGLRLEAFGRLHGVPVQTVDGPVVFRVYDASGASAASEEVDLVVTDPRPPEEESAREIETSTVGTEFQPAPLEPSATVGNEAAAGAAG